MKKILSFLSLTFLSLLLFAQQDKTNPSYFKMRFNTAFSGKAGIVWSFPKFDYIKLSATPVYQGSLEYITPNNVDFGLAVSYENFNLFINDPTLPAELNFDLYSFGIKLAYLLVNKPKEALYLGGRFSVNYWQATYSQYINLDTLDVDYWTWKFILKFLFPELQETQNGFSYDLDFSWYKFPLQLYFGYEYYFLRNFGFNFEFALGSPYIFTVGLNLKI